jgi:hypothetical protein
MQKPFIEQIEEIIAWNKENIIDNHVMYFLSKLEEFIDKRNIVKPEIVCFLNSNSNGRGVEIHWNIIRMLVYHNIIIYWCQSNQDDLEIHNLDISEEINFNIIFDFIENH